MKICLIGPPGSGKTWLASKLAESLELSHVEADLFYWKGEEEKSLVNFRREVKKQIAGDDWIFEGHLGKVSDISFLPHGRGRNAVDETIHDQPD